MGWTSTEKLFILFEDGKYVVFSNTGEILSQNKIFTESLSDIVLSANSSDDGFVAFTKNNKVSVPLRAVTRRIYVDCSGETPVTTVYPELPIVAGNRVECSCVFEARNNESGKVEFIVSCMDQSMYFIAEDSITEINIAVGALSVLNPRAASRDRSRHSRRAHPTRTWRASRPRGAARVLLGRRRQRGALLAYGGPAGGEPVRGLAEVHLRQGRLAVPGAGDGLFARVLLAQARDHPLRRRAREA